MARRVLPSRLELKRRAGSLSAAPQAKVNFTTFLYVSPVQMIPSCDHTGTPAGLEGFLHFTSSTASGSASRMSIRIRPSISPRQSLCDGEPPPFPPFEPLFVFFMMVSLSTSLLSLACHLDMSASYALPVAESNAF